MIKHVTTLFYNIPFRKAFNYTFFKHDANENCLLIFTKCYYEKKDIQSNIKSLLPFWIHFIPDWSAFSLNKSIFLLRFKTILYIRFKKEKFHNFNDLLIIGSYRNITQILLGGINSYYMIWIFKAFTKRLSNEYATGYCIFIFTFIS